MTATGSPEGARSRRQGYVAVLLLVTWPLALLSAVGAVGRSLAVLASVVAAASCLLGAGLLLLGGRTRRQAWRLAILATASSWIAGMALAVALDWVISQI